MPSYEHFNWFDRAWGSSLGLPEQLIRRMWRVATTDAEFFSEEGLLDASLIPLLGAMDSQRKDVKDKEFLGMINESFGTDMNTEGFLPTVFTSLLTDPLSYLTGAATVAAKSAKSANKLRRSAALRHVAITDDMTVKAVRAQAEDVLAKGLGTAKERHQLRMRLDKSVDLQDADKLGDLNKAEGQRQLMVTLPFLERFDAARFKVLSPEYQSWTRLAWDGVTKNGAAKALGSVTSAILPIARAVPGLSHTLNFMADIVHANTLSKRTLGLRTGAKRNEVFQNTEGEALAEFVQEYGGPYKYLVQEGPQKVVDKLKKDFAKGEKYRSQAAAAEKAGQKGRAKTASKAADKWEAKPKEELLLRAYGQGTAGTREEIVERGQALWRDLNQGREVPMFNSIQEYMRVLDGFPMGGELKAGSKAEHFPGYIENVGGAVDKLAHAGMSRTMNLGVQTALKEAGELKPVGKAVYAMMTRSRKKFREVFQTDFKSGELGFLKSEKLLRKDVARMTTAVHERARVLMPLMRDGAAEVNMEPEVFDTMLLSFLESSATAFEVDELTKLASLPGEDPMAYVRAVGRYAQRAAASMERTQDLLRKHGMDEVADRMDALGMRDILTTGIGAKYTPSARVGSKVSNTGKPKLRFGYPVGHTLPDGEQLGYLDAVGLDRARKAVDAPRQQSAKLARKLQSMPIMRDAEDLSTPVPQGTLKWKLDKVSGSRSAKGVDGTVYELKQRHSELKGLGLTKLWDLTANGKKIGTGGTLEEGKKALQAAANQAGGAKTKLAGKALADELKRLGIPKGKKTVEQQRQAIKDARIAQDADASAVKAELDALEKAELEADAHDEAIDILFDMRRRGYGAVVEWKPAKVKPDKVPEREPSEIGQLLGNGEIGEAGNLLQEAYQRMVMRTQELLRVGKADPVVLQELGAALSTVSEFTELTLRKGLGDSGNRALDVIRQTQQEVFRAGIDAGAINAGSPFAYIGRFLSQGQRALLRTAVDSIPKGARDKLMPQLSSGYMRTADHMSLHEVNNLAHELKKSAPDAEYTKTLVELAEAAGMDTNKYADSAGLSVLASFAQAQTRHVTAEFLDTMLEGGIEDGVRRLEGFEVVGVVNTVTNKKIAKSALDKKVTTADGVDTVKLKEVQEETNFPRNLLVLRDSAGKEVTVDFSQLDDGYGILPLGSRGGTIGESFALAVTDGAAEKLSQQIMTGAGITGESAQALVGTRVLAGNVELIGDASRMVSEQFKATNGWGHAYDAVHTQIKALQTVWRPDFHIANLSSSVFQMMLTEGVGVVQAGGGMMDAFRLLFSDQRNIADTIDMASELLDDSKGLKFFLRPARLAERVRRRGVLGGVKNADNAYFQFGDQAISFDEIFRVLDSEGLLGTFVQEGLRGNSTISETLVKLRDKAFTKSKLAGANKVARELQEMSETTARLASVFAHLRAGYSLETAANLTKRVMVDYADMTRLEQTGAKRLFSYYSFPRKFIPEAIKAFDKDPSKIGHLNSWVSGAMNTGHMTTQEGRLVLNVGEDKRIDPSRMAAPLDAMMVVPQLLAAAGVLAPSALPGYQADRQTLLAEGTPGFRQASALFQLGSMAEIGGIFAEDAKAGDLPKIEELSRITPLTRWMQTRLTGPLWSGDVDIPRGFAEEVLFQTLPYRQVAPNHDRDTLISRQASVQRLMQKRIEKAVKMGDSASVQRWQKALQETNEVIQALQNR